MREAVGVYRRTLNRSTCHDSTDADEDALSATPRIQGGTRERDCDDKADLVQQRDNSHPNTLIGPMEVGSESVVLQKSVQ